MEKGNTPQRFYTNAWWYFDINIILPTILLHIYQLSNVMLRKNFEKKQK